MAYNSIIGRTEEIKKLEKFLKSPKSEFAAIYGRRRVGKSYLVEEVYKNKIVFRAIGSYKPFLTHIAMPISASIQN